MRQNRPHWLRRYHRTVHRLSEKALGKKHADILTDLICKPEGKPTLAPESDPRPAMNITQTDFDCLTSDE